MNDNKYNFYKAIKWIGKDYVQEFGSVTFPKDVSKTETYYDWVGTASFKLWLMLAHNIIRGAGIQNGLCKYIYHNFYKENNLLPAYFRLNDMADKLKISVSSVRRAKKYLVDEGFIKVEPFVFYGKCRECFILGEHGEENDVRFEIMYAFERCIAVDKIKEMESFGNMQDVIAEYKELIGIK